MDKSSTTATLLLLLASSSLVVSLFVCIGVYISNQPQFQLICLYSSSHPILALNLLILLIIVSSRCFAFSPNINSVDQLPLSTTHSTHRIISFTPTLALEDASAERVAEAPTSNTKNKGKLGTTRNTTKEGSHLRQLKHSLITPEDNVRPPEISASSSLSTAKLRKEVSLTKEEVNRRVERFIRKFNDD